MTITTLPLDLVREVATNLDEPSATSLARALPSQSEEAVDSRIYRDIVITHAEQFEPTTHSVPYGLTPTSPITRPLADASRTSQDIMRSRGSKSVFQSHLAAIRARPWRAKQVRKVDLQLGHAIPRELTEILTLVSAGLIELRLVYPANLDHLTTESTTPCSIADVLEEPGLLVPALRRADIETGPHSARCLAALVERAPRLTALRVKGEVPDATLSQAFDVQSQIDPRLSPEISAELRLQVLELGPVFQSSIGLFSSVIRCSPQLSHLRLDDPFGICKAGSNSELVAAIYERVTLRHLDIPSSCLRALRNVETFDRLTHLTIAWTVADLNLVIPDSETSSPATQPLLPAFPNLETCKFESRSYDPGVPSYEVFRGRLFDLSIQAIRHHALRTSFASTPNLLSIDLGNMYGLANVGPIWSDYDHRDRWAGFDGALISRYTDGDDQLILIRHRSAFSCGWETYGVLNGKEVKTNILARLTDINGKSLNRAEPGQGKLSEAGWAVLRHWTAHL